MVVQPDLRSMNVQTYLAWEAAQDGKYEYIQGEVIGVPPTTKAHNRIAINLLTALDDHLLDRDCEIYMADIKVQVSSEGPYLYPDVVVTDDPRDRESNHLIQFPCLIVEVLSPATEAYDRGVKFTQYRRIPTLQEYVLIDVERTAVESFRRDHQGFWLYRPYEAGETIYLESVEFSCLIESLYRQVKCRG